MTYRDLTLKQWIGLRAIDTTQEDIDIQVDIIAVLRNITRDEVLDLPLNKYAEYAADTAFLNTPPKTKARRPERIVLNGRRYRVIKDVREMTAGQYIDFQTYLQGGAEKNIIPILSTVMIPEGKTYSTGYDIQQAIDDIGTLNVQDAIDLSAFFLRLSQHSIVTILTCLERKMKKIRKTPETREKMEEMIRNLHFLKGLIGSGDGHLR